MKRPVLRLIQGGGRKQNSKAHQVAEPQLCSICRCNLHWDFDEEGILIEQCPECGNIHPHQEANEL
jgi:hypothetical protein